MDFPHKLQDRLNVSEMNKFEMISYMSIASSAEQFRFGLTSGHSNHQTAVNRLFKKKNVLPSNKTSKKTKSQIK